MIKAPPENNTRGGFPKGAFAIDVDSPAATCPAGVVTTKVVRRSGGGIRFKFPADVCASCPLRSQCTSSKNGRSIDLGPHEDLLAQARAEQKTEGFKNVYNGKRLTVERVISRLVRRGGRKARYRGRDRVNEQLTLKAAAENLLRMLRLGVRWPAPRVPTLT